MITPLLISFITWAQPVLAIAGGMAIAFFGIRFGLKLFMSGFYKLYSEVKSAHEKKLKGAKA